MTKLLAVIHARHLHPMPLTPASFAGVAPQRKSLGGEYQGNEYFKAGDKLVERDKHRWELDPAASEDYKERK